MLSEVRRPGQLVLVAGESMPKLHQALSSTLSALGSEVERVYLDPAGGAEAYLLRDDELVLGAGALSCFGPAELASARNPAAPVNSQWLVDQRPYLALDAARGLAHGT